MRRRERTEDEIQALRIARGAISVSRAKEILRIKNWEHGGCLTQSEKPDLLEVTVAENRAVHELWNAIPEGTSSWMTALFRLVNEKGN